MFNCEKCGACCRNLNMASIYADLDRGNGTCKYLNGNLCEIYDKRPLKCRIDECYDVYFSTVMSKEDYYLLNYKMCKVLQAKEKEE